MCDGLGACIGECPEGAISIEKREAEAYNETTVMESMLPKGKNTVFAHLKHLQDHREFGFLKQGIDYLRKNAAGAGFDVEALLDELVKEDGPARVKAAPLIAGMHTIPQHSGCPGSQSKSFAGKPVHQNSPAEPADLSSTLTHWPVQLHLINPSAGHFRNADLLLAADCVAFSLGNFHQRWLKGKTLAIACPKLDSNKEIYVEKLTHMIDAAEVNTITVMIMEVPCCSGLLQLARMASGNAKRKVPIKVVKVGIQGEIINEQWT
jgi:ferredoxin